MIIRPAAIADIPGLVECAAIFFEQERLESLGMRLDEEYFAAWLHNGLAKCHIIAYVADEGDIIVGAIAGVFGPGIFCRDNQLLELWWFVRPESRGALGPRLLAKFEQTAQELGVKNIVMMAMSNGNQRGLAGLYDRLGYQELERHYFKPIGG